jgi:hypothetical protein
MDKIPPEDLRRNDVHVPLLLVAENSEAASEGPEEADVHEKISHLFGHVKVLPAKPAVSVFEYRYEFEDKAVLKQKCTRPLVDNYGEQEELGYLSLSNCVPVLKRENRRRQNNTKDKQG